MLMLLMSMIKTNRKAQYIQKIQYNNFWQPLEILDHETHFL